MPVETDEDRAGFVDPDEFGVAVTWTRSGVAQTPFNAIFNRPTIVYGDDGSAAATERKATLFCREMDIPAGAAEDDPVAVGGETTSYVCGVLRPDGTGFCLVELKATT